MPQWLVYVTAVGITLAFMYGVSWVVMWSRRENDRREIDDEAARRGFRVRSVRPWWVNRWFGIGRWRGVWYRVTGRDEAGRRQAAWVWFPGPKHVGKQAPVWFDDPAGR